MDRSVDYCKSASDVRKEWSSTIDNVMRERPAFIRRTRDRLILLDVATLRLAFESLTFDLLVYEEKDGSVTCAEEHLDLVENAPSSEECIRRMIASLRDYANDFYREFALWSKAPNRKSHIPYVLKVLASTDEEIREDIRCRAGKN